MNRKVSLSDEERTKIVKDIHQSYNQEVRKMRQLSDEEMKKIAKEVHEAYERVVEKVAKDSEFLNRLSREKAAAKIKQEKEDKQLLQSMKPSFMGWLLSIFKKSK